MPGHKKLNANSKDEVVILTEKSQEKPKSFKMEASSSPSASTSMVSSPSMASSLSVLDENLIKQIVSVAEIAIKNHVKQQKAAKEKELAKEVEADDDDEIQVLSETKTPSSTKTKSNQTVLQLGLPKDLQIKIIEQLKSSGKSAAQIDLHNLFSEVFSKTMKRINGLEVSNCSLRFTSNGKRRQSSDSSATPTQNDDSKSQLWNFVYLKANKAKNTSDHLFLVD